MELHFRILHGIPTKQNTPLHSKTSNEIVFGQPNASFHEWEITKVELEDFEEITSSPSSNEVADENHDHRMRGRMLSLLLCTPNSPALI